MIGAGEPNQERLWGCLLLACLTVWSSQVVAGIESTSLAATSATGSVVWFGPAGNSSDIQGLFRSPRDWTQARKRVNVFSLSDGQIEADSQRRRPLIADLQEVNAFRLLKRWGIRTAIGVPAVKEWDCAARQTPRIAVRSINTVYSYGGSVQYLEMDEPLISALGLNRPICKLGIDAAAKEVSDYANLVLRDESLVSHRWKPEFIDVEAYPSLTVSQIKQWIIALGNCGFRPAGFHLDVNVNYVEIHKDAAERLGPDLRELKQFLNQEKIPFGVIIWSGYDPLRSDKEYYDYAMAWVNKIHEEIGRPDRVAFQSWVTRCSKTGDCSAPDRGCGANDPPNCGTVSVPANLPEKGNAYSHTQLINDANAVLDGK